MVHMVVIFGFIAMICVVSILFLELFLMHLPLPPSHPTDNIELGCLMSHVSSDPA
jgi:hypothetical protein